MLAGCQKILVHYTKGFSVTLMISDKKNLKIAAVVCVSLSAFLAVYRVFLLFYHIDPANGLYTDAKSGSIFSALLFVLLVLALATYLFVRKYEFERPIKNESVMVAFSSSICALMTTAMFVYLVYGFIKDKSSFTFLSCAEAVLCIPSAIYFFLVCFRGAKIDKDAPATYSLLPLFPALFTAVRAIIIFIDTTHQINASQRSFSLLTLIFIMMFFVTEAEFSVSRFLKGDKKPKQLAKLTAKYFALGLTSTVLTTVVILSYLLVCAFWIFDSANLLHNIMCVCFGLYSLTRVLSV